MTVTFPWRELLTQWSMEIIESGDFDDYLELEAIEAGWLGYPGATEEQIAAAEARLGMRLPPSYREFLKVTNGWGIISSFIDQLWSIEEIEWFCIRDPETVAIWTGHDQRIQNIDLYIQGYLQHMADNLGIKNQVPPLMSMDEPDVSDEEYLIYGENVDQPLRPEYLITALEISAYGDGIYLLNPQIVTEEGEWEAWFFASWIPGAHRYRSFWEMMQAEHESFLQIRKHSRGEPTPYAHPELGVDAEDLDGLLAALRSSSSDKRMLALDALGNLRDKRATEPVLAVFQNPDEDLFLREHAARTLGMLRDERAVEPLIDTFRTPPEQMDNMKVTSILENTSGMPFGPDEIDETFGNMTLKDFVEQMPNVLGPVLGADFMAQMREQAAAMFAHPGKGFADHLNYTVSGALLELGDLAMPALYAALRDEDRNVRYQVASTLARVHGGDEQIVHLRTALTDPDPDVRGIVAAQLDQNGNPGSIDLLLLAYQDAESSVRERAIIGSHNWVIGWQDKRLIAALRQLSKHDPDSAVRSRAREMLQAIEPMQ